MVAATVDVRVDVQALGRTVVVGAVSRQVRARHSGVVVERASAGQATRYFDIASLGSSWPLRLRVFERFGALSSKNSRGG